MHIETLRGTHEISQNSWTTIAGPCSAESQEQIKRTAEAVVYSKAQILRAGTWKPRTDANASWHGAGKEALEWMKTAKRETGIAIATEVNGPETIELALCAQVDVLWIGSRSGTYYPLLEEVGRQTSVNKLPIILKRTMGGDLRDWLGAAEYILKYNPNVILCERGISGFPRETKNVLDLQTAKIAQEKSELPVIIDVSHAAGRKDLIEPMALAAKAAGFNGLMVEVHPTPRIAKTDASQQISLEDFARLMERLITIPSYFPK